MKITQQEKELDILTDEQNNKIKNKIIGVDHMNGKLLFNPEKTHALLGVKYMFDIVAAEIISVKHNKESHQLSGTVELKDIPYAITSEPPQNALSYYEIPSEDSEKPSFVYLVAREQIHPICTVKVVDNSKCKFDVEAGTFSGQVEIIGLPTEASKMSAKDIDIIMNATKTKHEEQQVDMFEETDISKKKDPDKHSIEFIETKLYDQLCKWFVENDLAKTELIDDTEFLNLMKLHEEEIADTLKWSRGDFVVVETALTGRSREEKLKEVEEEVKKLVESPGEIQDAAKKSDKKQKIGRYMKMKEVKSGSIIVLELYPEDPTKDREFVIYSYRGHNFVFANRDVGKVVFKALKEHEHFKKYFNDKQSYLMSVDELCRITNNEVEEYPVVMVKNAFSFLQKIASAEGIKNLVSGTPPEENPPKVKSKKDKRKGV